MNGTTAWTPYCGAAPVPDTLIGRWNDDPLIIGLLVVASGAYFMRVRANSVQRWSFSAALLILVALFISPFCALTSALFAARVVHHIVLTALVAPLLVMALAPLLRPRGGLAIWTALHTVIFWFWHAPPVYEAALSSDVVYWAMQGTLLASAFAFWARIRTAPLPAGVVALLAITVQMGLLGALLTFGSGALYAPHYLATQPWDMSPLEDQQLAGLMMWAPGAGFYLAAALLLLARWFGAEEKAVPAR